MERFLHTWLYKLFVTIFTAHSVKQNQLGFYNKTKKWNSLQMSSWNLSYIFNQSTISKVNFLK
jgi:hypothetical protein